MHTRMLVGDRTTRILGDSWKRYFPRFQNRGTITQQLKCLKSSPHKPFTKAVSKGSPFSTAASESKGLVLKCALAVGIRSQIIPPR